MDKTIVMIHGMWGGGWYWENYKKYFETKGYTCLTPTLPFHNKDPKNTPDLQLGKMGLFEYADYLEKLIKKPGDPPVLMGHSMGGLLAQILGSRGLAKAMILLTPAPPYGINALKSSVLKSFWDVLTSHKIILRYGFWNKPMRLSFNKAVYSMLHLVPADQQKKIYKRFVYESGRAAFQIGFWLFDGKKASKVDENKIKCPVLVISGKEADLSKIEIRN